MKVKANIIITLNGILFAPLAIDAVLFMLFFLSVSNVCITWRETNEAFADAR